MKQAWFLPDAAATGRLGVALAHAQPGPAVVFLHGDLGAGKSSLARAMLHALGVIGPVKSPTYTLVERYALAQGDALHLDLYRIAASSELEFLGLDDGAACTRLWLVEWPDRGAGALPPPDLHVLLNHVAQGRQVELDSASELGKLWIERLNKIMGPGCVA